MMKLSKEKQQHLAVVIMVTAMVTVALWYFVISAQQTTLTKVRKKTEDVTANLEKARNTVKTEAIVLTDLTAKTNELSAVELGMPSGNDKYFWFISSLNRFKIPYQHMVDIPHVSRETIADVGSYMGFPYKAAVFQVRGTAHYHNFGRFLADFENKFTHFRIQKLYMYPAPADASDEPERISFEMEIVTLINPN